MTYKNIDDIERDKQERAREKIKENITSDIDDVVKELFKTFRGETEKRKRERKNKESWLIKLLKLLGVIGLGLLVLNFILVNVWLLRFFIKSLFNL